MITAGQPGASARATAQAYPNPAADAGCLVLPEAWALPLEAQLPADWSAQQVYDNHEALMLHGQKVCFPRGPKCGKCVVLDLCPFGQGRVTTSSGQSASE